MNKSQERVHSKFQNNNKLTKSEQPRKHYNFTEFPLFSQKKEVKNISLNAVIQVDIEDMKRHINHREESEDYSQSEDKS